MPTFRVRPPQRPSHKTTTTRHRKRRLPDAQHHILCSTHVHLAHVQPHGVTQQLHSTHARHAHARVKRESRHTRRACPPALREPLRSLFLLPLTCVGPDTWLPFFLCRRRPLRFGTRLGEGVLSEGARTGYWFASRSTSCFSSFFSSCFSPCFYLFSPKGEAGNPNCHVVFSLRAKLVMISDLDFCVFVHSALLCQSVVTALASVYGAFTRCLTFPA